MKKLFALLLALMMVLSLAACGGGDDEKTPSNDDNPPSSSQQQEQNTPDPDPVESEPEDTTAPDEGSDASDIPEDAIRITTIRASYSGSEKMGSLSINFERPNGEAIEFERADVDIENSGFSTSDDVKLIKVSVVSNGGFAFVTVYYEATEENYGNLTQISYEPTETPLIKTVSGETVEAFSHEVPYMTEDEWYWTK